MSLQGFASFSPDGETPLEFLSSVFLYALPPDLWELANENVQELLALMLLQELLSEPDDCHNLPNENCVELEVCAYVAS